MRKTKIICTIGPASENEEVLTQMCLAGMNVARLNFSHGSYEEHERKIALIKQVRQKLDLPIAIMLDTKGPEYRIKTFATGSVTILEGQNFTFVAEDIEGDETKVSVSYKRLAKDLKPGDIVTVNNGLVKFKVLEIAGKDVVCKCLVGGVLSNRKSMSFPNKVMSGPYLSEQDKSDIIFGIQHGVDFVAASFVSTKQDVLDIRELLDSNGGEDIEIIAKIENQAGVDNVEEICSVCGGIMIARGDLGVEIPFVEVPQVQKSLIFNSINEANIVFVICAEVINHFLTDQLNYLLYIDAIIKAQMGCDKILLRLYFNAVKLIVAYNKAFFICAHELCCRNTVLKCVKMINLGHLNHTLGSTGNDAGDDRSFPIIMIISCAKDIDSVFRIKNSHSIIRRDKLKHIGEMRIED